MCYIHVLQYLSVQGGPKVAPFLYTL